MKKLFFLFGLFISLTTLAQFPNVLISTLNEPEEVCIAINPKNTQQIVAGSNINNTYRSNDGGLTWISNTLSCSAYDVWGDPVVIWDTANICYYLHLSNPSPSITPGGSWIDRIVIQKSSDFGQNYTSCDAVGKNGAKAQDKAWAVVNPANNEMHVTWTQFDNYLNPTPSDSSIILYSKTTNGGASWTSPLRISHYAGDCVDSDDTDEGAVPAIGPNGEVYVAWAGPKGLVFQKSLNGGVTWLPVETIIGQIPGGWDYNINGINRCNGLPFTFCDLSNGPNRGTIYVNWSDQRNGTNDGDIWLVKSVDGGTTWSSPIRVNNDVPGKQQFMSTMTIDQVTGYVYVLFYDRRNFASGTGTDVYLGVSMNGGNSFVNYKVNATSFYPSSNVFFGDYIGISAHNNIVRPMWTQMTGGALSVYTALVDPLTVGIYEARQESLGSITASPNPFKTETKVEFSVSKPLFMNIELVDNEGRILNMLANNKEYLAGKHSLNISAAQFNLKPGVYYLVFYGDEKSKYIKLLLN